MTRFESISNMAVIVVAGCVLVFTAYNRFTPRVPNFSAELARQFIGKPLEFAPVNTDTQGAVALFLSKDCHFCSDSMDFYHRLATLGSGPSCEIGLVAVGPRNRESRQDIEEYLAKHQLNVNRTVMVNYSDLGVAGTPTLMLLDRSGVVRGVWTGYLQETAQEDVVRKARAFCPAS